VPEVRRRAGAAVDGAGTAIQRRRMVRERLRSEEQRARGRSRAFGKETGHGKQIREQVRYRKCWKQRQRQRLRFNFYLDSEPQEGLIERHGAR